MVRAAAKNHEHVGVVVDPADYGPVLDELRRDGSLSARHPARLARHAFAHTAGYDAAIVEWLDEREPAVGAVPGSRPVPSATDPAALLPPTIHLTLERAGSMRYGENPHQHGARYRVVGQHSWWDEVVQHGGKELSYLNIFDADAAWRLVHELRAPDSDDVAVAIIKHANPCGAALDADLAGPTRGPSTAIRSRPSAASWPSAGRVTEAVAEAIAAGPQADVIIAPSYDEDALASPLLEAQGDPAAVRPRSRADRPPVPRRSGRACWCRTPTGSSSIPPSWEVATSARPTEAQWRDLVMAWKVCARTTSNAIAVVADGQAVGVGAGQQSRVVAAEIAVAKAGERARGGAAASDAFFPFPDGLVVLADAGVAAVVQPGGSIRDDEVVAAADEAGIAMVMAGGERHFRH